MKVKRHKLNHKQFDLIKHLLPESPGKVGPTVDNHKFLNAVFFYLKTGTPWKDLPPKYGKWKSVHRRFSRWCKQGSFKKIFELLVLSYKDDFADIQLDSSIVKAHQDSTGGGEKRLNT